MWVPCPSAGVLQTVKVTPDGWLCATGTKLCCAAAAANSLTLASCC